jgi:hypothetical protein
MDIYNGLAVGWRKILTSGELPKPRNPSQSKLALWIEMDFAALVTGRRKMLGKADAPDYLISAVRGFVSARNFSFHLLFSPFPRGVIFLLP